MFSYEVTQKAEEITKKLNETKNLEFYYGYTPA